MDQIKEIELTRITPEVRRRQKDYIVSEIPLTILVNGKELVTLQCTPDKLEQLTVGYLLSEGFIEQGTEIEEISLNEKAWYVKIYLKGGVPLETDLSFKRVVGSGCAGAVNFYRSIDGRDCVPLESGVRFSRENIFNLMRQFQRKSLLFKDTGGVHSCALCHQEEILTFAEDIGRHNAVDKVFGECYLNKISIQDLAIFTSGRVSSEILIKIAKQKIPILVSHSAPTDLAVAMAEKLRITLVGFVRGSRMSVYTHDFRIA